MAQTYKMISLLDTNNVPLEKGQGPSKLNEHQKDGFRRRNRKIIQSKSEKRKKWWHHFCHYKSIGQCPTSTSSCRRSTLGSSSATRNWFAFRMERKTIYFLIEINKQTQGVESPKSAEISRNKKPSSYEQKKKPWLKR